jgi:ABC-type oligopeptide transport system ATPase subunit
MREPVSSLDVSVQASIVMPRRKSGAQHDDPDSTDLSTVRLSNHVVVMYLGRIVEGRAR